MCHLDNLLLYAVSFKLQCNLKNFYFRHETSKLCCFAIFFSDEKKVTLVSVSQRQRKQSQQTDN